MALTSFLGLPSLSDIWNGIKGWVTDLINVGLDVLRAVFSGVTNAAEWLWRAADAALSAVEQLFSDIGWFIWNIWTKYLPDLFKDVENLVSQIADLAQKAYGWVEQVVSWVKALITSTIDGIWSDVIKYVWDPIKTSLDNAWNVLTDVYNTLSGWITNPGSLVALIFVPLLNYVASLSESALTTIVEWAARLFINNLGTFLRVAEDSLTALF